MGARIRAAVGPDRHGQRGGRPGPARARREGAGRSGSSSRCARSARSGSAGSSGARRTAGCRPDTSSVGEVVCHCLREWEAEQQVLELSRRAARRALRRGGPWAGPGRRLGDQATAARRGRRVSTLPFQVLFAERSSPRAHEAPLSATLAARRIGYEAAGGRCDTQRLLRRLGLASPSRRALRQTAGASARCATRPGWRSAARSRSTPSSSGCEGRERRWHSCSPPTR